MPVAGPYRAFAAGERSANDGIPVSAVRLAAVVLAPRCLIRVLMEKVTTDPMMLADFRAALVKGGTYRTPAAAASADYNREDVRASGRRV
jgi:hypothetical protein